MSNYLFLFGLSGFSLSLVGPAMMPGGDAEAYKYLQPIVEKVAAQTDDGACVTYVGVGGAGMVFISLDVCVLFFYL